MDTHDPPGRIAGGICAAPTDGKRTRPTAPLAALSCAGVPGVRVELWCAQAGGAATGGLTSGGDLDALRFHLESCPPLEVCADGVHEVLPACPAGSCSMLDYSPRRHWRGSNSDMIVFRLSRGALTDWARANGHQRFNGLVYASGIAFDDPVLANLALAMHRSLRDDRAVAPAFTSMILEAVLHYIIEAFGTTIPERHRGGLAGWQVRAIEGLVEKRLEGAITLTELAEICGLSVSYFVKAFRTTRGVTPHQWLIARRVDRARDLLRSRSMSLADVAISCGFADQSHFTRMFSKIAGISPGLWRKQMQSVALCTGPSGEIGAAAPCIAC